MANDAALEVLLQDAQDRVQQLMTELYAKRRELWETQQALNQSVAQRDAATRRTQEMEQYVADLQANVQRIPTLESEQHRLLQSNQSLEVELMKVKDLSKQLLADLDNERILRKKAEEAKTWAEAERARLQRSRDDLALKLKVSERRLKEAEEEQIRAEQDLAAAQNELRAVHRGTNLHAEPSLGKDASPELLHQLENERSRSSALLAALDNEKAKCTALAADIETLKAKLKEHQEAPTLKPQTPEPQPTARSNRQDGTSTAPAEAAQGGPPDAPATHPHTAQEQPHMQELHDLQVKVMMLKRTRDKLLAQLDAQAAEMDRLVNENLALQTGLDGARDTARRWEDQLQDSLAQNERLKDLLEDSVNWTGPSSRLTPTKQPQDPSTPGTPKTDAAVNGDGDDLEKKLAEERARVAELDLQVRALCAELTRASQSTAELNQSILPMLNGIESRLEAVTRLSASKTVTV